MGTDSFNKNCLFDIIVADVIVEISLFDIQFKRIFDFQLPSLLDQVMLSLLDLNG
jgi:hypothetical protein